MSNVNIVTENDGSNTALLKFKCGRDLVDVGQCQHGCEKVMLSLDPTILAFFRVLGTFLCFFAHCDMPRRIEWCSCTLDKKYLKSTELG